MEQEIEYSSIEQELKEFKRNALTHGVSMIVVAVITYLALSFIF